ncbi:NADH-cytochrome b5 reductase-like [Macrosteles quadrilineatus]|uniref:NADH-cytochrome b5 reductase-like n=1 Tax=Macrosteles quadrilineatus TaxID=74068 RepID=UPI0023E0AA15|nr:NADH-cytochrome b5 reductase-like [Macrosteles quadrilineatus]
MEPEKPDPSDCCGSGCSPCVFDIYEQQLKSWRENLLWENANCRRDLLSETRFKSFQLIHKERLTEDVYLYKFRPEDDSGSIRETCGFLPYGIGQHLITRINFKQESQEINPMWDTEFNSSETSSISDKKIITRAYTPVSLTNEEPNCCFKIFVKICNNGLGSEYFRNLQVGDISLWRGPYGNFNYKSNFFKYILMVCIGTGLAPMIPIAKCILNDEKDETILHLMYGVKSEDHIIMRDSLRKMSQFWNFSHEYFFSQCNDRKFHMKFGESFKSKRIDGSSVSDFFQGKNLTHLQVLICGSEGFTSYMLDQISKLGIDSENIFTF